MSELLVFPINLLLVLTIAWIFGKASERVGYPAIMGELFAGIVFGPAVLGILQPDAALTILAELGVFLLMVYVGMEIDVGDFSDAKRPAFLVAIGGLIIPFILGYWLALYFGVDRNAAFFVGIAMAATSLATKSRVLVDLKLLHTRIAKVMIGGALMSDVGILILFAGVIGFIELGTFDALGLGLVVLKAVVFFVASIIVGLRLFPLLWSRMQGLMDRHGFIDKTSAFTVFLLIALAFAALAVATGLHIILGGFMAGLFMREVHFRKEIFTHMYDVLYDLAIGFFAPIFFVTATFSLTLSVLFESPHILLAFVAVAFGSKIVGSWLFSLPAGLSSREGWVIGFGMNDRGTVEIIIATIALQQMIITQELFSILVFIAILTTAIVPFTLKWGVRWLSRHGELVAGEPKPSTPGPPRQL